MHTALHPFVWLSAIIQYLSLCLNTALPVYKMLLCSRFVAENNDISRRLQIATLVEHLYGTIDRWWVVIYSLT